MRARRALLVVAAVALVAGRSRTDALPEVSVAPAPPRAVAVTTIARRPVPRVLEPVGTVRARRQSALSSKIVAAVVAVHVVQGQRVRAAREEARQAPEEADQALRASDRAQEAARAQQDLARATLGRDRVLLDRRVTVFAPIFSIGILVDDPIVGVENTVRHFREVPDAAEDGRGRRALA